MTNLKNKPNVCIIIIDALRAKNLGCYGYDKNTSPNIDKLSKKGVMFNNCFSCINTTDPSITTILSGKYPHSHGLINHGENVKKSDIGRLANTTSLQKILKKNGYTTLAVDWLGRWHANGFDYYSGPIANQMKILRKIISYARLLINEDNVRKLNKHTPLLNKIISSNQYDDAKKVTGCAIELIDKHKNDDFFLFVHYWDVHIPYNPPQKYLNRFIDEPYHTTDKVEDILANIKEEGWRTYMEKWMGENNNVSELLAKYDAEINYVDNEIGRLVSKFEDLGIMDKTIFIITSDHGESLTEHGIYFDHHGLYDFNVNVPLIITNEKIPPNKNISAQIQHIDIVPTILELIDIDTHKCDFDGASLTPLFDTDDLKFREFVCFQEVHAQKRFAIRSHEYKYIYAPSEDGLVCKYCGVIHGAEEELYNLKNDPNELLNIIDDELGIKLKLKKELLQLMNKSSCSKHALIQKIQKIKVPRKSS